MTFYYSDVLHIPGMDFTDAVPYGSVAKVAGTPWSDGGAVMLDVTTGAWKPASGGSAGLVVADGAATSGATVANVKILPHILLGNVGASSDYVTRGRVYRDGGQQLRATIAHDDRTYTVPVRKVSGETWALGDGIYRIDDPASVNFRSYTKTFGVTNTHVGAASGPAGLLDIVGYLEIPVLYADGIPGAVYQSSIVEVGKTIGETWTASGLRVYTDGTIYTTGSVLRPGMWAVGYSVAPSPAISTRGWISHGFQACDDLSLLMYLTRADLVALVPVNFTAVFLLGKVVGDDGVMGTLDTYYLKYRPYALIAPVISAVGSLAYQMADSWWPGLCHDFLPSIFSTGSFSAPTGLKVIWLQSLDSRIIEPQLFAAAVTGDAPTGLPFPPHRATNYPAGGISVYTRHVENPDFSSTQDTYQMTRVGAIRGILVFVINASATTASIEAKLEQLTVDHTIVGADKSVWTAVGGYTALSVTFSGGGGVNTYAGTLSFADRLLLTRHLRIKVRTTPTIGFPSETVITSTNYQIDNVGCLPYEYDVPRWNCLIQPANVPLITSAYLGRHLTPPTATPLVWSGGYSAAIALGADQYVVTITATRASLPAGGDTQKFKKATTWTAALVDPVRGDWLQDQTSCFFENIPVRLALLPVSPTTDAWGDVASFTCAINLAHRHAAATAFTIEITATTQCRSLYFESDENGTTNDLYIEQDTQRVVVTIPAIP